jgi:hypothetical protein
MRPPPGAVEIAFRVSDEAARIRGISWRSSELMQLLVSVFCARASGVTIAAIAKVAARVRPPFCHVFVISPPYALRPAPSLNLLPPGVFSGWTSAPSPM